MTSLDQQPTARRQLPIAPTVRHGSRSLATCYFRCGNACDQPVPNTSINGHIQDEISRVVRRRSVLKGSALASGALVLGTGATLVPAAAAAPESRAAERAMTNLARTPFRPVRPNRRDAVTVADGFDHSVVMRWGDRVVEGRPASTPSRRPPRPRGCSSVTTVTTWASCSCVATRRCSWSTTSTPTRT